MVKVFINAGHGGIDPGAVGYVTEKKQNLLMALACKAYLEAAGVEVYMAEADLEDKSQTASDEMKECKKFNPDYAIDIHNNAGGGDGFEIYHSVVGGAGKTLAKNIEAEVIKIGQNSRGVKTRKNSRGTDYYYFIRQTDCPAVICEGAFVDNKADAAQIDEEKECKAFGEAYAKGILKTIGIDNEGIVETDKPELKPEEKEEESKSEKEEESKPEKEEGFKPYLVKVTTDALRIRKAPSLKAKVVDMIRDRGVYTILDEIKADGYTWGRLKSGAGYIALEYTKKVK